MLRILLNNNLNFNGIHKSYENCDSYTFKQNEVSMDKPIYIGFTVLEISKLHLCETYFDILQPYFGKKSLHLHYMVTDSFILSVNTKDTIGDLKNFQDIIDFGNKDQNHELFSDKNKTVNGKFKIETPTNVWIDEFLFLRSKLYSFKCLDYNKNKLKGVSKSQSKHIKFEEYKETV